MNAPGNSRPTILAWASVSNTKALGWGCGRHSFNSWTKECLFAIIQGMPQQTRPHACNALTMQRKDVEENFISFTQEILNN
jgi:hypothetical protein